MKVEQRWVLLADEVPDIGCGWRLVFVRCGRKWVRLKSATAPSPRNWRRIRLSVWNEIEKVTETVGIPWPRNKTEATGVVENVSHHYVQPNIG